VDFEFVDSTPAQLLPATIYVSIKYRLIVHLCLCGCGEKVTLNLAPDAWNFTFDGKTLSIHDSVLNIGMPCQSHYIVEQSRVHWLERVTDLDPRVALGVSLRSREPWYRRLTQRMRWGRQRR
jgi:hypothetical protein